MIYKEELLAMKKCYDKRKIIRNIIVIILFMVVGSILGTLIAKMQQAQLLDPEYIKFLHDNNMQVPEPIPSNSLIIGFWLLFGGIATGIIEYVFFLKKYVKTSSMSVVLLLFGSIMLLPIYGIIGAVTCIPFLIFQIYLLIFRSKRNH